MSIIQRIIEKKQSEKSDQEKQQPTNRPGQSHRVDSLQQTNAKRPFSDREVKSKKGITTKKSAIDSPHSKPVIKLDFKILEKKGYLTPFISESQLAEEYRRIKRPLLVNAFENHAEIKNGNIILVTSSLPNEGKTFTALNLAMSISMERDKTVLLVDADLQKAGLSNQFNLNKVIGLAELLDNEVGDLREILYETNIDNLRIIPSGNRKPNSAELLASNDMQLLVQELANRYSDRVIIMDSPPLLARSESSVLAKLLGQVVVVVEAEQTVQTVVKEALEQLEECEIVNLVFNKRHNRPGLSSYSGYYGY